MRVVAAAVVVGLLALACSPSNPPDNGDAGTDAGTGLEADLLALYTFNAPYAGEQSVPDERLGTYPATNIGSMPVVTGVDGQGLSFAADGQALRIPTEVLHNRSTGTISMWVKRNDTSLVRLLAHQNPGVAGELGIEVLPSGAVSFFLEETLTAPVVLQVGTFHHLAVTWGPEGKRIYVDGGLVAMDTAPAAIGDLGTVTELGRDPNRPTTTGSRADIDELAFFERALTDEELRTFAALPFDLGGAVPTNVRAHYTFDDLSIADSTGTYDGSQVGMTDTAGVKSGAVAWTGDAQAVILPEALLDDVAEGTLSLWIRRDATQLLRLLAKVQPGVLAELGMELNADGFVSFSVDGALQTKVPLPLGVFRHLAVSWGAQGRRIYLDGYLVAADSISAAVGSQSTVTEMGRDPNQPNTTGSRGAVDEMRVYSRALSLAEIRALVLTP